MHRQYTGEGVMEPEAIFVLTSALVLFIVGFIYYFWERHNDAK
jgi:hypothetical protein